MRWSVDGNVCTFGFVHGGRKSFGREILMREFRFSQVETVRVSSSLLSDGVE